MSETPRDEDEPAGQPDDPAGAAPPAGRGRRRWFVAAIAVGAAVIVVALCAGALSIVAAFRGVQDRATDARDIRRARAADCLDLERRLNRLVPPGATGGAKQRAAAIRDENAAVRIYLGQLESPRTEDGWRQLLDARTVYADALAQAGPAFYVAPETADGVAVADELQRLSPDACGGVLRRLAAPDL